ncbi:MAG: hypothetical protein FVQ77_04700 [Cytophagales bacterium]|nr:hypothetical protein [Cytophagales bacterium]
MKLLFDQNLSPKLILSLEDLFENSLHVQTIGLDKESDDKVWSFAKKENYIIITKDADFSERVFFHGYPPKVIWIKRGNCSTKIIESLLRDHYKEILNLSQHEETGILILR